MIADLLACYLRIYPEETKKFGLLAKQVRVGDKLDDRRNFTGHVTGSAIILSPDKKKILLIHHKAYDQWQQPGGHWEKGEPNPLEAARREGAEETGLVLGKNMPVDPENPLVPFDIDSHAVPARPSKAEPGHYHHDFRYIFIAEGKAPRHQQAEIIAAKWLDFDAAETERIKSIIKKLKRRKIIT